MINFLSDYTDFFLFLIGLLLIVGIIYLFFSRRLQGIFISEEEISKLEASNPISKNQILFSKNPQNIDPQTLVKKLSIILLIIIFAGFLLNQFLMWRTGSVGISGEQVLSFGEKLFSISINITKKYAWYGNPRYYLAAILLIWSFRLIFDALHTLLPKVITFNGSILDGLLYVVLFVSLVLLLRKGWRRGSSFSFLLVSGRPASILCSMQYCINPGMCRSLC